jgi:hypothetical protein
MNCGNVLPMSSVSIHELKQQRRWVLWRLEPGKNGKPTKVPYSPSGYKISITDHSQLHTFAELEPHVVGFSGCGMALGLVDGVDVTGVDFDLCCDAAFGKFSPESREVVIALNSYAEYSPSGLGCHIWVIGGIKGPGLQKSYPGCKQIEVKGLGYYQTFTGRHLSKTPVTLENRQEEITALYDRVSKIAGRKNQNGLRVSVPVSEEARFQKLLAGDMSGHNDDHSAADFALCILLAKKHNCNAFKIDSEFRESGLYRGKWERDDYRETTITRAIVAVAKETPILDNADDVIEDDGVDEYLVNALSKDHEGWFPKGDVSLIGGSSGTGKTYWVMTLLEKVRNGAEVWGHTSTAREYRVVMLDRGAKAMRRTLNKLALSDEARDRVIRVTGAQQTSGPVAVLTAATEGNPGAEAWFIEGLDLWLKEANKMSEVAQALDDLQRLATRRNVAIIASVGSSKEKTAEGRDTERYHGRDTLFGSVAWGRKTETIVLISKTDQDPIHDDCARQYSVLVRNGRSEHFWMDFKDGELRMVSRPEAPEHVYMGPPKKAALLKRNILAQFKPGERIIYSPELGASEKTYYAWLKVAVDEGLIERRDNGHWMLESPKWRSGVVWTN